MVYESSVSSLYRAIYHHRLASWDPSPAAACETAVPSAHAADLVPARKASDLHHSVLRHISQGKIYRQRWESPVKHGCLSR